jgi:hypothetical protein
LQVGLEPALGFIVGMTDIETDHWFFSAHSALLGHMPSPFRFRLGVFLGGGPAHA